MPGGYGSTAPATRRRQRPRPGAVPAGCGGTGRRSGRSSAPGRAIASSSRSPAWCGTRAIRSCWRRCGRRRRFACSGWSGTGCRSDHGADMEPLFAAAAAALGPRFRRLGYRTDVARLLAGADVFALPSRFRGAADVGDRGDALPGLPVVATDISGPREMVVRGRDRIAGAARHGGPVGRGAAGPGGGSAAPCPHGRGRPRPRAGALSPRPRWWAGRWTCWGLTAAIP